MVAGFFRDVLRSVRSWRRTPGSALLMILALGLSGGAFITLVSLFNALFWRELPVPHPEELVGVSAQERGMPDWETDGIPVVLFTALDRAQNVFQAFAGFEHVDATAVIRKTSQRMAVEGVSGHYFETLGVRPALGRVVGEDEAAHAAPVAVISFPCWRAQFAADPGVIGQTFRLNGELVTVIGVAPRSFSGLEVGIPANAWVPESLLSRVVNQPADLSTYSALVGRLRPGGTLQSARSQLETLWPTVRQSTADALPEARRYALALESRIQSGARGFSIYGVFYRRTLRLLILSSVITLVLSCANLSGLLLARWSTRETDLAVQAALGASNGRLVSLVVGESFALSMLAVLLSAPLAVWSAKSLTVLLWNQPNVSSPLDVSLDYRVLGVMVGLAGVVAVSVSLLPASRIWFGKLTLSRGTRGLPGRSVTRWGRWLVAAQVALSVPLLVTAWIVTANLHRLHGVDTGFRPDGVIVVDTTNQGGIAPAADPVGYLTRLTSGLRATPGISSAALSWSEPLSFGADGRRRPLSGDDGLHGVRSFVVQVSPGYFETLSVPFVAGRDFMWTDDRRVRDVAILSEGVANALFPGADPVGRRVRLAGQSDRLFEVIGVVVDAKLATPQTRNQLFLFTALLQEPARALALSSPVVLLKSPLPPGTVEAQARRTIAAFERQDVVDVHPLQHTLDSALLGERVIRLGASYFAGLTALLMFVGLYAVLNIGIMRRIPEIGLRLALGASTHDIRKAVIREAFVTAAAGLAAGIPCAFVSGRVIASSLTLVGSHDAMAFGGAIVLTLAICALSVLIPLRRASQITPLEALASQ